MHTQGGRTKLSLVVGDGRINVRKLKIRIKPQTVTGSGIRKSPRKSSVCHCGHQNILPLAFVAAGSPRCCWEGKIEVLTFNSSTAEWFCKHSQGCGQRAVHRHSNNGEKTEKKNTTNNFYAVFISLWSLMLCAE